MVGIVANDNFLSLFQNSASNSLSSQKKTEKIKKIKLVSKLNILKLKEPLM
jgi:hypothetical protein